MDPLTHGLASLALKRGLFPRAPRAATLAILLAGVIPDVDWASYYFGPSAFLSLHRTSSHSLLAAAAVSLLLTGLVFLLERKSAAARPNLTLFVGALSAGLLHVALDACQSAGVTLTWPFRANRVSLDCFPNFDPWILAILLFAILVPELFLLVSSEIGVKSSRPRGRAGALAGLALLLVYSGARAELHSNAVAMLQPRIYAGESPRRVAAFPDTFSLFSWHGLVETPSAFHLLQFSVAPGAFFNAQSATTAHKPEDSPFLQAARNTPAARKFLEMARFPKAAVEKETGGFSVELRDLRYAAMHQTVGAIQAEINLDATGAVTSQQLAWEKDNPRR